MYGVKLKPRYTLPHHALGDVLLAAPRVNEHIRYEPDEPCPLPLMAAVAVQGAALAVTPIALQVLVNFGVGVVEASYLTWAVFMALVINGVITILNTARLGQFSVGHPLMMGSSGAFVSASVPALMVGGPALASSLIIVGSLIQFALARWLSLVRRIITPVVAGTMQMLIALSVAPPVIARLGDIPAGAPPLGALAAAGATLLVALTLAMRSPGLLRLWSAVIGIGAGCVVAALFGIYDFGPVAAAPWWGLPHWRSWAGIDLTPGVEFWTLLPIYLVVFLATGVRGVDDGFVMQRTARRRPRATDFRLVQGLVNTTWLCNLLSGIAGTAPVTSYSSISVALINITGVASRSTGYAIGALMVVLAMLPKLIALLLAIPGPVMCAFVMILLGLIFMEGARTVVQDGLDYRKALAAGVAVLAGVAVGNSSVFTDLLGDSWGRLLGSGITFGTATAILLSVLMELTNPRARRLRAELAVSALTPIDRFLSQLADSLGWNPASTERLRSAGEETLTSLLGQEDEDPQARPRRLLVTARPESGAVELEFVAAAEEENLEDRLALLSNQEEEPNEDEISFRLLRHYADSIHHRQYRGIYVVTVRVRGSRQE